MNAPNARLPVCTRSLTCIFSAVLGVAVHPRGEARRRQKKSLGGQSRWATQAAGTDADGKVRFPTVAEGDGGRLAYPVDEAARQLGIGRTSLYRLIGDGKITPVKIGGRTVVPAAEL